MTDPVSSDPPSEHRSVYLGPDWPTIFSAVLIVVPLAFTLLSPLLQLIRLWLRN